MSQPQTVLITGSSSGFGRLTVRTLLERGHTVFATMRESAGKNADAADELRSFAADVPGTVHVLDLDVTQTQSVEAAVREVLNRAEHIDVVINNAGYGVGGFTEAFTPEQLEQALDVNVVGVHRVNRAVLPSMRSRGSGLLVHVSSVMGRIVLPFAGPYTAAKYALEGLAESYRYELAGTGVDVVIVEPGGFGTNFMANMQTPADEERQASYGELTELPQQMWSGVAEGLQADDAPDPQTVADAIADLIDASPGERPLRTVIDPLMGGEAPKTINRTTDQVQNELLTSVGMEHLWSVQRAN